MTKKVRIGLLWQTLGHPNLGVDALSRANIAILRSACSRVGLEPEFVLLGTPGPHEPDEPGVSQGPGPGLKQMILGRGEFISAVKNCDIFFDTSEGDSFTDIYGLRRCIIQSGSKLIAARTGRPLVLSPQTIGPFNATWSRLLARHVINRAEMVFARDHLSTQALQQLGGNARAPEVIDVAFRLPFKPGERLAGEKIGVGVNVSGLMYLAAHRFQMKIDYPAFIRELLGRLTKRDDVEVWLVPHVLADGSEDDDVAVNDLIQKEFPSAKLAPKFKSSIEAKSFISRLDVFTGARMHACIAAFSSGVPVIPVAYSRKFNGLFQSLEYPHFIDGRASSNTSALDLFDRVLAGRSAVKSDVTAGLSRAQTKLAEYEAALVGVLSEACRDRAS